MNSDSLTNNGAMTIAAGQFLIYCLKGCERDLLLLRDGLLKYLCVAFNEQSTEKNIQEFENALRLFVKLLCDRNSLSKDAEIVISEKSTAILRALILGGDLAEPLAQLKIIDAWSGITGAMRGMPLPLSFLDYVIDMILPVLGAPEISVALTKISRLFVEEGSDNDSILDDLDNILTIIVKKVCPGGCLDQASSNELKLAVLIHLPRINNDISMRSGFAFKLLQFRYSNMEVA